MSQGQEIPLNKMETEQAKAEHEARRVMAKEDEDRILTQAESESKRLQEGGTNWALMNYLLNTISFKDVKTMKDAMYRLYELLFPWITRQSRDNAFLKVLVKEKFPEDQWSETMKEIMDREAPTVFATRVLKEIQEAAKQRSKANVYREKSKKIIVKS